MRPLLLASSLSLMLAAAAAADPDVAPQSAIPSAADATPQTAIPSAAVTPPAAPPIAATPTAPEAPKKVQSSGETKPKADAEKSAAEVRKVSDSYFKQCMQDWDTATHMTRREWERACRRVVQARAKFMLEQMGR